MTPPVSESYFLTRQAANLMEDFVRQLAEGSAIYLLYGDSGIGKTRLLRELRQSRLKDRRVHRIDLKTTGPSAGLTLDRSAEVVKLFSKTGKGDIIIADHFESASHKTRHQLFKCWKIDGKKKQLNFIISCVTHGFNDLRQLAQLYKLRIQSFQQMPFSRDEIDAFVAFYLFPDEPQGKLAMPPELRRELTNSRGNVGKVIEIINREGAQVKMLDAEESASEGAGRNRIWAALAAALLLVVGLLLYFNTQQAEISQAPLAVDEVVVSMNEVDAPGVVIAQPSKEKPEPAVEAVAQPTPQQQVEESPVLAEQTPVQAETVASPPPVEPQPEPEVAEVALVEESDKVEIAAPEAADAEVEAVAAVSAEVSAVASEAVTLASIQPQVESSPAVPPKDSLQQRLQDSMQWLKKSERSRGTVQIMWIGTDSFDEQAYQTYIDDLEAGKVDTSQIRIFRAKSGNRSVYNVFFGEYRSRQDASNAIAGLPRRLRVNSPFPRTVGGIRDEISR